MKATAQKQSGKQSGAADQAADCLALLQERLDAALSHLKRECSADGGFSHALLDKHQKISFELAFCAAEIEASRAMLDYARANNTQDAVCERMALAFCAETVRSVWQRLFSHAAEAGLPPADLLEVIGREPLAGFLVTHGRVAEYEALGRELMARGDARLPSGLAPEKDMIRDSFARFTQQNVMPVAARIHRDDADIPDDLIRAAAVMGCFGTSIPERFGGSMPDTGPDTPSDSLDMLVVTEELSRGSLGAAGSLITRPEIAARALLHGGTADQQAEWLPGLASGETLAAIAFTEPDFGSDVASFALQATRSEGGWRLNGAKTWCTFAGKADVLVALARTDTGPSTGHRGLSMFLVPKPRFSGHEFTHRDGRGGTLSGKAIRTIGYRGMHSFDLSFDNVCVPAGNLVGGSEGEERGEGRGFHLAMAGLAGGRIQTAARACGVMQAAIERATSYAADRKVFGAPIGDYQLTRVKLGRMWAALTASRQFAYAVARTMGASGAEPGPGSGMLASLVKLYSCRAAEWVTREAMQIHGGMGYAEESDVSRYFVDARVLSIFEGAEETLALKVIARGLIANALIVGQGPTQK